MTMLYRLFDAGERLLYVGIADVWPARMKQHAAEKLWWCQVANVRLEDFPTRDLAANAERKAIRLEKPAFNVVHNSGKDTPERPPRRPANPTTGFPLRRDQCVALGMSGGECPVGLVRGVTGGWVHLWLLDYSTALFRKGNREYDMAKVEDVRWATWHWEDRNEWGIRTGQTHLHFDTDPLGEWQEWWLLDRTSEQKPA